MVDEMVLKNNLLSRTDILFQKSVRYKYHKGNYLKSLKEGIVPRGLKLRKEPAFVPVSEDFKSKWKRVLWNAEINLVKLFLSEPDVVIDKVNKDIQEYLHAQYPKMFGQKRLEMEKK